MKKLVRYTEIPEKKRTTIELGVEFKVNDIEQSITGPKSCLKIFTSDTALLPIESQIKRMKKSLNIFDLQIEDPFAQYTLKYTSSICPAKWEVTDKRVSIGECARLCYNQDGCVIFGAGKGTKAKYCALGGVECNFRQKSSLQDYDVYAIVGVQEGAFKWFRQFAQCNSGGNRLTPMQSRMVSNAESCASVCFMATSGLYFSWDEGLERAYDESGVSTKCRCFEKDYTCAVGEECCPANSKGINCYEQYGINHYDTIRKECSLKQAPTTNIGIILETLERAALSLSCPAPNTFITTNMPTIGRHRVDYVENCLALCTDNMDCRYAAYEVKSENCFLLAGAMTSTSTKVGWIIGSRQCAKKLQIVPQSLYWDEALYL